MWKEFRKSWEAWREKVDEAIGGTVEPIDGANVSFDPTDTDLSATNVQGAIEEVNDKIHDYAAPDAEHVDYDNTDSGLVATNVQDAINEINTALADKVDKVTGKGLSENDYTDTDKAIVDGVTTALAGKVDKTSVGAANGVAELGADGKVLSSQLPAAVDSIVEGYYYNDKFYEEATHETEITPASNVIYIDLVSEKTYRWGGTVYVEISQSLALGETSSTAYRGDRGKTAYDFSQTPYASNPAEDGTASAGSSTAWSRGDHVHPHDSTKVDKVNGKGLSANDFTDTLKTKLDGIAAGAEVNVQADYAQSDDTADDYIKNKPAVDASPTSGSDNLVKSGGVYSGLVSRLKKYQWNIGTSHLEITIPTSGAGEIVELHTGIFSIVLDYDGTSIRILDMGISTRDRDYEVTYSISGNTIIFDSGASKMRGFILSVLDGITVTVSSTSTPQANNLDILRLDTVATTTSNGLMSAADKAKLDDLQYSYKVSGYPYHLSIKITSVGTLVKVLTNQGDFWLMRTSSSGITIGDGGVIASRKDATPVWTYSVSGDTININCSASLRVIALSTAPIEITSSTTSTPEANNMPVCNLGVLTSGSGNIYTRIGDIVVVRWNSWVKLSDFTGIPAGFRPKSEVLCVMELKTDASGSNKADRVTIGTDGSVTLANNSYTYFVGTITYIGE